MLIEQTRVTDEQLVRDSVIRSRAKNTINSIVVALHEQFPYITPDHITALGALGVAIAALWTSLRTQKSTVETTAQIGLYGASSSLDALDGGLARLIKLSGQQHDSRRGQLVDVGADRLQELFLALSRLSQAIKRNDQLGALLALGATVTNTLPSLYRAKAEEQGIAPGEGKNIVEITGSRLGRAVLAVSTFIPEIGHVNTQNLADLTTLSANLYLSYKRRKLISQPVASAVLKQETRKLGSERKELLKKLLGVSAVSAVGLYILLTRSQKRNG